MAKETKYSIKNLQEQFPTDEACLAFLFDQRHSRTCSCGGTYKPVKGRKQFQCSKCRYQIAPTAGTIFHKSDTPLTSWFHAIFIFSNAKSGISAKEMERQLGVTYKCAWRILSQIRKALKQGDEKFKGTVEMDSGYLGGRHYGGKNNEQLGDAMAKKSVVTVAVQRGYKSKVKAEAKPNVTANELQAFIEKNVARNQTWVMTDGAKGYKRNRNKYFMDSVDHSKKEFVRGSVHVNNVETWFSHIKRSIKGTYKTISKKHLQSYLDAFAFHYNNRHNDKERFEVLLGALLQSAR